MAEISHFLRESAGKNRESAEKIKEQDQQVKEQKAQIERPTNQLAVEATHLLLVDDCCDVI